MPRVIFTLTEEQNEQLETLAKRSGIKKAEALRRFLELYRLIKEAQRDGSEFRRIDKDGKERIVEVVA